MNIYMAARFGRYEELQGYAAQLEALGHTVVSRWHMPYHVHQSAARDAEPTLREQQTWALEDLADIRRADMMVSFTEAPRSAEGSRGGRHVELGIALALGKYCILVGPREHVFHWLAAQRYDTFSDLLAWGA